MADGPDLKYPLAPTDEWYGEANYKTTGGNLVEMTPEDFLSRVRPLDLDETSRENIDLLKDHIVSGRSLDPLQIYRDGSEDGRHRAHAARELGIKKIPVITWTEPRPPDQSNLPAVIDAAAEASRLALPPDDEPRPKKKPFGSGVGSLMIRRMFPLIQAVQQGYEHLLTEEQKNDLREFLAQPTHEFFGFEKSGLESLKEKLGISNQEPPGLPMDLSSRLSRMREMGFDLDAYHGTTEGDPAAWDPENTVRESFLGSDRGYSSWPSDIGDWFTEDPYVASSGFAEGEGGHVIPVKLRLKNPAVYPTYEDLESALAEFPDTEEFREYLQKKGHDGILIEDSFTDVPVSREDYVVFDNKNIRSRFARFDPADSESGDISKAHGGFVVKPLYDS